MSTQAVSGLILPEGVEYTNALQKFLEPHGASDLGFIRPDDNLEEICTEDAQTLADQGITHKQVADRLRQVFARAKAAFTDPRLRDELGSNRYSVSALIDHEIVVPRFASSRGFQLCPFGCGLIEPGKSIIKVTNTVFPEDEFMASELSPHLIETHHFFQNGPYRVDPEKALRVLKIQPEKEYTVTYRTEYFPMLDDTFESYPKEHWDLAQTLSKEERVEKGGYTWFKLQIPNLDRPQIPSPHNFLYGFALPNATKDEMPDTIRVFNVELPLAYYLERQEMLPEKLVVRLLPDKKAVPDYTADALIAEPTQEEMTDYLEKKV